MTTDPDAAWRHFGETDPYFSVLTAERFRGDNLDAEARADFFATGEHEVRESLESIRTHLVPDFEPRRALDFGCGVGRLLLPLAARCDEAVGVDVSPAMLAEARRNGDEFGVTNATFVLGDDSLSGVDGTFDLVHSQIVFQHIPRARGERIMTSLVDRLRPGGVGILHFTYAYASNSNPFRRRLNTLYRYVPLAYQLRSLIRGRKSVPLMQMNTYDVGRLLRILQECGCTDVHVVFTEGLAYRMPIYGVVLSFVKPGSPST